MNIMKSSKIFRFIDWCAAHISNFGLHLIAVLQRRLQFTGYRMTEELLPISQTSKTDMSAPGFHPISTAANSFARLGVFNPSKRQGLSITNQIETPNIIIPTSRGCIPHLTPDNVQRHVKVPAVYVGLEDFVDRVPMTAPLAQCGRRIREFISILPEKTDSGSKDIPIFLAPRRSNPIPSSQANSDNTLAIVTNDGFRQLSIPDYWRLGHQIRDENTVIIAPIDLPLLMSPISSPGAGLLTRDIKRIGGNRARKLSSRNELWSVATLQRFAKDSAVIVPLIPGISMDQQSGYLKSISGLNDHIETIDGTATRLETGNVSGLAVMDLSSPFLSEPSAAKDDVDLLAEKVMYKPASDASLTSSLTADFSVLPNELHDTLRLSLTYLHGPHDVLTVIKNGHDLILGDWITTTTDAGVAFTFSLPANGRAIDATHEKQDIGINLWNTDKYATDLEPIVERCECYTCTRHHRAYIAHLLNAKEMLAWTLLQIHNIHVANKFMREIRMSLQAGEFEDAASVFEKKYAVRIEGLVHGGGPRVRGYQVRLAGATTKRLNESPFQHFKADDDM
ncbi:uncharacterized protein V1518DRAFT_409556 [Limtongia smithiae]|uniref:uncharacterized protein n=1 Tax=Limtongia smithiae TaxID=1125753 RepID=UPI0034CF923E